MACCAYRKRLTYTERYLQDRYCVKNIMKSPNSVFQETKQRSLFYRFTKKFKLVLSLRIYFQGFFDWNFVIQKHRLKEKYNIDFLSSKRSRTRTAQILAGSISATGRKKIKALQGNSAFSEHEALYNVREKISLGIF